MTNLIPSDEYLYDEVEKLNIKFSMRAIIYLIENKQSTPIENFKFELFDWVMINYAGDINNNEVGQIIYINNYNVYMYIFDEGIIPIIKYGTLINPISSICKNSYLESIKNLHKEIINAKIKKDMIKITNFILEIKLKKNIYWN
jgi:hypothetical protein